MTDKHEVKEEVKEIQSKIKPHLKWEDGSLEVGKEAFEASLPEHLTPKVFQQVEDHKKNLASGLLLETQSHSEKEMKKGTIDKATSRMQLGRSGSIEVEVNRKETRPKSVQDRTPIDVYGSSRVKFKSSAQNKSGNLKAAQSIIEERARSLWGE